MRAMCSLRQGPQSTLLTESAKVVLGARKSKFIRSCPFVEHDPECRGNATTCSTTPEARVRQASRIRPLRFCVSIAASHPAGHVGVLHKSVQILSAIYLWSCLLSTVADRL